jgi:hypothetical protein
MAQHEQPSKTSEWYTPKYIFEALGVRFDLDAAAPENRSGFFVPAVLFGYGNKAIEALKNADRDGLGIALRHNS